MKPLFTKKLFLFALLALVTSITYAAPVITINGDNPLKQQINTPYIDKGATAVDDNGLDITSQIVVTGAVNESAFGSYKITYTVTDNNGKTTSVTRTVIVNDCIKPVIKSLQGSEVMVVCLYDFNFTEPRVTATDNYFPFVNITRAGFFDLTKVGSYSITYTATDGAGNSSTYTRIVIVKDCRKPPLSVSEGLSKDKISVYPNPATNLIIVELHGDATYTAALSDIKGKTMLLQDISPTNNRLNVKHLKQGIYFLTVKGLQTSFTKKVIITK